MVIFYSRVIDFITFHMNFMYVFNLSRHLPLYYSYYNISRFIPPIHSTST